jgi:hypothetical protein
MADEAGPDVAAPMTAESTSVLFAPFVRIVPEQDGGWLVLTHKGHGWLHGSGRDALEDKRWLDNQWRQR